MKMTLRSLAVVLTLALSACGGAVVGGGSTPPPSNQSVAAGTFLISNQTSGTVCYAMFSPASDPNWGPDQLGSSTIGSGETYAWTVGLGVWDVKLEDCDHNTVLERRGVDIQGAGTILTVTN